MLVVVDLQEPFLSAIYGRDTLLANVVLLCRAARILGVPILVTEQYAGRMGSVIAEIAEAVGPSVAPVDKLCFSCAQSPAFRRALEATGRNQVVVCGVETHICVSQTAHDLRHAGHAVHVVADASSSRTLERHKLGMERIRDAGIKPAAAEAVVYEWLREAGTPEFKEILSLVK
ncbi:MAG: hydrolase [Cytophagales bacterium]|nr:hydrolase [Armatimonadota bacterium]